MHDLLAAIQTIEPTAIPLVAILLSSAAMYAVGFLTTCKRECCECSLCTTGSLPETVTVTFGNVVDAQLLEPRVELLSTRPSIGFLSNHGSGAVARITAPIGTAGPITATEMIHGGRGYAWPARTPPDVSIDRIASLGGSGAVLEPIVELLPVDGKKGWTITGANVIDGGDGYANNDQVFYGVNGETFTNNHAVVISTTRVAPPVSVSVTPRVPVGLNASPVMVETTGGWAVQSVTINSAGSGFAVGDAIVAQFSEGSGITEVEPAVMAVSAVNGSGGVTAVSVTDGGVYTGEIDLDIEPAAGHVGDFPTLWEVLAAVPGGYTITAVNGSGGGSGFTVGDQLAVVSYSGAFAITPAIITVASVSASGGIQSVTLVDGGLYNGPPDLGVEASAQAGNGSGAVLSATLSGGPQFWGVASIAITSPGSGYGVGDVVNVTTATAWHTSTPAVITVASVSQTGGITGVTISNAGQYYRPKGDISSVTPFTYGWRRWNIDMTQPGDVANVTVSVFGGTGPTGTGASLTANIDRDTTSDTFGQITSLTINDGGTNYLVSKPYTPTPCCADIYNGKSVVLKRDAAGASPGNIGYGPSVPAKCVYSGWMCGAHGWTQVELAYNGPFTLPVLRFSDLWGVTLPGTANYFDCGNWMYATSPVADCESMNITLEADDGSTATVAAGGVYDATDTDDRGRCHPCCRDAGDGPTEVTVRLWKKVNGALEDQGTYVLTGVYPSYQFAIPGPAGASIGRIIVWVEVCAHAASYPGETVGCAHCWKKCSTRAEYRDTAGGGDRYASDACANCVDSPVCTPATGTRQLRRVFSNGNNVGNGAVGDWVIDIEP